MYLNARLFHIMEIYFFKVSIIYEKWVLKMSIIKKVNYIKDLGITFNKYPKFKVRILEKIY